MAPRKRFGHTPIGSSSRRKTAWNVGPHTAGLFTASAAGAVLFNTGVTPTVSGLTIVRLRGEFTAWISVATTLGDGFQGSAVGFGIVNEEAFAAGITSVPSPIDDPEWNGWLYHKYIGSMVSLETTEVARGPLGAVRFDIDSKAMRRFRTDDVIIGVYELLTEIGTAVVTVESKTRLLFKLP